MRKLLERLAFEDDRLFNSGWWVVGSGVGMVAAMGAYIAYRTVQQGTFGLADTLFVAIGGPTIVLSAAGLLLLFFFPRYLPIGLGAITLYIVYTIFTFVA